MSVWCNVKTPRPIVSPLFATVTLLASTGVAYLAAGQPFATLRSSDLLRFGAVDARLLYNGELWRLLTSQLVHFKQLHMLFNVLICLLLGNFLERNISRLQFALLYWISGTLGVLVSVGLFPLYMGSGASQAMMGLCSAILFLKVTGELEVPNRVLAVVYAAMAIQLALDLYAVQYPKPGHVIGFVAGALFMLAISMLHPASGLARKDRGRNYRNCRTRNLSGKES